MSVPRYLFVFDDLSRVFTTTDDPTPEDLEAAVLGTAVIVRLADVHAFGRDGRWKRIPGAVLIPGHRTRTTPFHWTDETID